MSRSLARTTLICAVVCILVAPCVMSATTTIKVWTGYPESLPVYKAAAEDYMKEHPGVKVEVSAFDLRDVEKKYAIALPAGTAPDVCECSDLFAQQFMGTDLLDPAPSDVQKWTENSFDGIYCKPFQYRKKIYAIPWTQGFQVLYYNKDHYAEAGITAPPKNLDELMSHARKLAKYDAAGNLVRSGISLRVSGGGMGVAQKFEIFLFANGGSVLEPAGDGKWKANFNNEAGYQALNFYLQALHKYRVDSINMKHDSEAFVLGLASQLNRETFVIGESRNRAPKMQYGIAQVVGGSAGHVTNLVTEGLTVASSSKNKELAWDFAMFLNRDKYLVQMMRDVGWICTRSGVDYSEVYKVEPHFEQAIARPKNMRLVQSPTAASFTEVYTKFSSRLVDVFTDATMVDNRTRISRFLQDCADEANEILKSNGEYGQ